jgi:hypothetical protein
VIACPAESVHVGRLEYSRWAAMSLPESVDVNAASTRAQISLGSMTTRRLDRADAVAWHVNFADPHLFAAYGSPRYSGSPVKDADYPPE